MFVEEAQDLVAAEIRQFEQDPRDCGLAVGLQCGTICRRVENRNRQRCGISSRGNGSLPKARGGCFRLPAPSRTRKPAVAEFNDPAQRMLAFPAEQNGRMRLLLRLGIEPYGIEIDELAMKFGPVFGPQLLHGKHAFAQDLET